MKKIIKKLKNYIKKKIISLNSLLVDQFTYYYRAEYLKNCVQNSNESGISTEKYCDAEVIVSLTTFGRRLYDVYLTIESIMQQTLKPNRIILWLGEELKNTDIPLSLHRQERRGLKIKYCKDIRAYTKLIPALAEFPSAAIITIDDDCLYHFDLVENLVNAYKKNPKLIYCSRMHRIKLYNNRLKKYKRWTWNYDGFDVSPLNFPTGIGGVLYPPHCFNEEIFNEKVFMDICKYADDVWYKAMALLNNTLSQKIYTHNKNGEDYLLNERIQDVSSLSHINVKKAMNDVQLKAVFDKYNLYDRFSL
jgi:hypothetical protein